MGDGAREEAREEATIALARESIESWGTVRSDRGGGIGRLQLVVTVLSTVTWQRAMGLGQGFTGGPSLVSWLLVVRGSNEGSSAAEAYDEESVELNDDLVSVKAFPGRPCDLLVSWRLAESIKPFPRASSGNTRLSSLSSRCISVGSCLLLSS